MSITDEIHKAAQKSQNSSDRDKILQFPTEYPPYQAFSAPTSDPLLRGKSSEAAISRHTTAENATQSEFYQNFSTFTLK